MESFITYEVKTETDRVEFSAQQLCIRRRYQDFLWLKEKLEAIHPGNAPNCSPLKRGIITLLNPRLLLAALK